MLWGSGVRGGRSATSRVARWKWGNGGHTGVGRGGVGTVVFVWPMDRFLERTGFRVCGNVRKLEIGGGKKNGKKNCRPIPGKRKNPMLARGNHIFRSVVPITRHLRPSHPQTSNIVRTMSLSPSPSDATTSPPPVPTNPLSDIEVRTKPVRQCMLLPYYPLSTQFSSSILDESARNSL